MLAYRTVSKLALVIGLGAAVAASLPGLARAGSVTSASAVAGPVQSRPTATIDAFYAELVSVMRNGRQLGPEGRYRKLEPVVDRTFNLPLMTQVAIGPRWSSLSADERTKLTEAFRRFTIASYANHFADFTDQRFEVLPETQSVQGATLVLSRLNVRDRQKPVQLNYVMRETEGRWQVIDVYAEGTISELARRRSEFGAVLNRSGVDALADRLVERAQTLLNQPA
ncbi:MAG: ABC transporter substrate-binding protein [Alphaproteobacteria bacterium]|nr:ABC transporter substrate-binding protein [Alphaproteobacteria bacterium]